MSVQITTCRSCGRKIWWTETKDKKKMPVDFKNGEQIKLLYEMGMDPLKFDAAIMTSHFSTCPNAAHHRRPRR